MVFRYHSREDSGYHYRGCLALQAEVQLVDVATYRIDLLRSGIVLPSASRQVAEKVAIFVIPSEARNLSEGYADKKNERFLASLGMTKSREIFSPACQISHLPEAVARRDDSSPCFSRASSPGSTINWEPRWSVK
jgi:hypothetical protein